MRWSDALEARKDDAMSRSILYLHGFRSSPTSFKARLMADAMAERGLAGAWACPQLPASPRQAIDLAMDIARRQLEGAPDPRALTVIGSSLGGFYATWLAEQLGCQAVLLNPAVQAPRDLATQVGEHRMYHSDEPFVFLPEYVDELTAIHAPAITRPERYFLVAATGTKCWTGAKCATATRAAASASCRAATTACPTSPAGCPRFSNSRLARSRSPPIIHLCPELHNDSCTTAARARRPGRSTTMYVFYEDDGSFKAGNILSETDASLQVESESGKRSKIKRANTLFTFAAPEPAALMSQAAAAAEALDLQFLWECAPQEEFDSPPWPPIISATPPRRSNRPRC